MGRDIQREYRFEPQVALFCRCSSGSMASRNEQVAGQHGRRERSVARAIPPADEHRRRLLPTYYEFVTEFPLDEARALIGRCPDGGQEASGPARRRHLPRRGTVRRRGVNGSASTARERRRPRSPTSWFPPPKPRPTERSGFLDCSCWLAWRRHQRGPAERWNRRRCGSTESRLPDPAAEILFRDGMVLQIGRRRFARVQVSGGQSGPNNRARRSRPTCQAGSPNAAHPLPQRPTLNRQRPRNPPSAAGAGDVSGGWGRL